MNHSTNPLNGPPPSQPHPSRPPPNYPVPQPLNISSVAITNQRNLAYPQQRSPIQCRTSNYYTPQNDQMNIMNNCQLHSNQSNVQQMPFTTSPLIQENANRQQMYSNQFQTISNQFVNGMHAIHNNSQNISPNYNKINLNSNNMNQIDDNLHQLAKTYVNYRGHSINSCNNEGANIISTPPIIDLIVPQNVKNIVKKEMGPNNNNNNNNNICQNKAQLPAANDSIVKNGNCNNISINNNSNVANNVNICDAFNNINDSTHENDMMESLMQNKPIWIITNFENDDLCVYRLSSIQTYAAKKTEFYKQHAFFVSFKNNIAKVAMKRYSENLSKRDNHIFYEKATSSLNLDHFGYLIGPIFWPIAEMSRVLPKNIEYKDYHLIAKYILNEVYGLDFVNSNIKKQFNPKNGIFVQGFKKLFDEIGSDYDRIACINYANSNNSILFQRKIDQNGILSDEIHEVVEFPLRADATYTLLSNKSKFQFASTVLSLFTKSEVRKVKIRARSILDSMNDNSNCNNNNNSNYSDNSIVDDLELIEAKLNDEINNGNIFVAKSSKTFSALEKENSNNKSNRQLSNLQHSNLKQSNLQLSSSTMNNNINSQLKPRKAAVVAKRRIKECFNKEMKNSCIEIDSESEDDDINALLKNSNNNMINMNGSNSNNNGISNHASYDIASDAKYESNVNNAVSTDNTHSEILESFRSSINPELYKMLRKQNKKWSNDEIITQMKNWNKNTVNASSKTSVNASNENNNSNVFDEWIVENGDGKCDNNKINSIEKQLLYYFKTPKIRFCNLTPHERNDLKKLFASNRVIYFNEKYRVIQDLDDNYELCDQLFDSLNINFNFPVNYPLRYDSQNDGLLTALNPSQLSKLLTNGELIENTMIYFHLIYCNIAPKLNALYVNNAIQDAKDSNKSLNNNSIDNILTAQKRNLMNKLYPKYIITNNNIDTMLTFSQLSDYLNGMQIKEFVNCNQANDWINSFISDSDTFLTLKLKIIEVCNNGNFRLDEVNSIIMDNVIDDEKDNDVTKQYKNQLQNANFYWFMIDQTVNIIANHIKSNHSHYFNTYTLLNVWIIVTKFFNYCLSSNLSFLNRFTLDNIAAIFIQNLIVSECDKNEYKRNEIDAMIQLETEMYYNYKDWIKNAIINNNLREPYPTNYELIDWPIEKHNKQSSTSNNCSHNDDATNIKKTILNKHNKCVQNLKSFSSLNIANHNKQQHQLFSQLSGIVANSTKANTTPQMRVSVGNNNAEHKYNELENNNATNDSKFGFEYYINLMNNNTYCEFENLRKMCSEEFDLIIVTMNNLSEFGLEQFGSTRRDILQRFGTLKYKFDLESKLTADSLIVNNQSIRFKPKKQYFLDVAAILLIAKELNNSDWVIKLETDQTINNSNGAKSRKNGAKWHQIKSEIIFSNIDEDALIRVCGLNRPVKYASIYNQGYIPKPTDPNFEIYDSPFILILRKDPKFAGNERLDESNQIKAYNMFLNEFKTYLTDKHFIKLVKKVSFINNIVDNAVVFKWEPAAAAGAALRGAIVVIMKVFFKDWEYWYEWNETDLVDSNAEWINTNIIQSNEIIKQCMKRKIDEIENDRIDTSHMRMREFRNSYDTRSNNNYNSNNNTNYGYNKFPRFNNNYNHNFNSYNSRASRDRSQPPRKRLKMSHLRNDYNQNNYFNNNNSNNYNRRVFHTNNRNNGRNSASNSNNFFTSNNRYLRHNNTNDNQSNRFHDKATNNQYQTRQISGSKYQMKNRNSSTLPNFQ